MLLKLLLLGVAGAVKLMDAGEIAAAVREHQFVVVNHSYDESQRGQDLSDIFKMAETQYKTSAPKNVDTVWVQNVLSNDSGKLPILQITLASKYSFKTIIFELERKEKKTQAAQRLFD